MGIKIVKGAGSELVPSADNLSGGEASALKKFNRFFETLGNFFIDRDTELQQIRLALLTKEHVLFKGCPGTAKSLLARSVFTNITGAKSYEVQFSKFMSEDYVFGPINVKKLREDGEIVHNTKGTIVDADFAFIDEFFDGSDVLLRSMLEILNERTFTRNAKRLECPLHTAILTSNFTREEESTEAILDRILFRSDVQPISDSDGRMAMYKTMLNKKAAGKIEGISQKDLLTLSEFVMGEENVKIGESVLSVYDQVVREYMRQGSKVVSDRTANKMLNILKGSAVLHGRDEVLMEDILSTQLVLCASNDTVQTQVFENVYSRIVVQGKKEQEELVEVIKLKRKFEKMMKSELSTDKEKGTILKIRELQKFIETDLKDARFTTQNTKDEVEKLGSTIDTAIENLKDSLNS